MKCHLDIAERVPVPDAFREILPEIFRETLSRFLEKMKKIQDEELSFSASFAFVAPEEIRQLNHKYRDADRPTDVLSFPDISPEELHSLLQDPLTKEIFLGEVVVCYDEIVRAAEEDSVSEMRELAFIVSHGFLHLLGMDHSEAMFVLQDSVTDRIVGNQ